MHEQHEGPFRQVKEQGVPAKAKALQSRSRKPDAGAAPSEIFFFFIKIPSQESRTSDADIQHLSHPTKDCILDASSSWLN
jgi:hypothetical protein